MTDAVVIVSGPNISAGVGTWVDSRGFTHSTGVLKRQRGYNAWLATMRGNSAPVIHIPRADDPAAPLSLVLEDIPVTGG